MPPDEPDALAAALRRSLVWVLGLTIAGLAIGGLYLRFATKRHVAVAQVMIERSFARNAADESAMPATTAATASGEHANATDASTLDAVIDAQAQILRSTDVIRLADANGDFGSLRTFALSNASADRDPVAAVRRDLRVEHKPGTPTLTVAYAAADPDDAERVVNEVVKAYQKYQSDQRTQHARDLQGSIETQRRELGDRLATARRDLANFDVNGGGGAAPAAQQVQSLADALTTAQLDTFAARRTYDDALTNAGPATAGLNDQQLDDALRQAGATAADSSDLLTQEASGLSQQLTDLRRTYAANHPAVVRATQRLKQIRLIQLASARQRWTAAKARETDLRVTLEQVQANAATQAARTIARQRLAANVDRLADQADTLDHQYAEVAFASTATALAITPLGDAEVDPHEYPSLPRPAPTLATAGLIGLILGGLLALIGEYRSVGTLRHVVPAPREAGGASAAGERATKALGVPVLGSIPDAADVADDADEAETDVPVALAAQHDPFGPMANAVRTMRRAVEIEGKLPATLLLTAAGDGQGTTTLALNLATTIAREGRKVLIVDLNFGRPALAELLKTDGTRGLSELVAGGDPVELIRTTSIQRLDLLGTGAAPSDSGAMLNDERFLRLLTMLTSAYDHVIFDGGALSRGDDARIVASVCDATVLVARPSPASLRRAAGARDLLLTVGANLLGAALNRVGEAGRPQSGSAGPKTTTDLNLQALRLEHIAEEGSPPSEQG